MESGFANAIEFTNASTVCPDSNRPELPETVSESMSSGIEDPPRPESLVSFTRIYACIPAFAERVSTMVSKRIASTPSSASTHICS